MAKRRTVTLTFNIVTRASEAEVGAHIDRNMGELVEVERSTRQFAPLAARKPK
jgi:hypothetical protein